MYKLTVVQGGIVELSDGKQVLANSEHKLLSGDLPETIQQKLEILVDKANFAEQAIERVFGISDIKIFNPKELDGKILKVSVTESEGMILIAGQDVETEVFYVISQQGTE